MNKVILDLFDVGIEDGILMCPYCGGQYLHQVEVEIGWRPEDGDVNRTLSTATKTTLDVVEAKNVPSPNGYGYRRSYLVIRFSCELCNGGPKLEIRQHKGCTILRWIETEEARLIAEGATLPFDEIDWDDEALLIAGEESVSFDEVEWNDE